MNSYTTDALIRICIYYKADGANLKKIYPSFT